MPASEAARLDLYNGLSEILGPKRAETLMTYLPATAQGELVTKADFDAFRSEFDSFRSEVNARFDRLFLALLAGLFTIVAAMAGVILAVL